MSRATDWGRAYAKQALADFTTWITLHQHADIPGSQKLHFLQMACEKLAKAHLCIAGADPFQLQSSHAYIASTLPIIVQDQIARTTGKRPKAWAYILRLSRQIAREIELLSPAVDDNNRRPDNCEYPWEDSAGLLHVPAEYAFPTLNLLTSPAGRTFLKLVYEAIRRLT